MKKWFFLCVIIFININTSVAESIITVDIKENGDALWTVERHESIVTQADMRNWEELVNKEYKYRYEKDIEQFKNSIGWIIAPADNFSARKMKIENFNISYNMKKTISGYTGIVIYTFEWKKFSYFNSSKIYVGDAFVDGMELSFDQILVINMPEGYELQNVSPKYDKYDNKSIMWDGKIQRNFSKGTPSLVLSKTVDDIVVEETGNSWYGISIVVILSFIILVLLYNKNYEKIGNKIKDSKDFRISYKLDKFKKYIINKFSKPKTKIEPEPKTETGTETSMDVLENGDSLDYEDMIKQYLLKSNGQAYQSDIVNQSGFSKSKISIVLTDMKEKGKIIKIKKGKENIIRIAK